MPHRIPESSSTRARPLLEGCTAVARRAGAAHSLPLRPAHTMVTPPGAHQRPTAPSPAHRCAGGPGPSGLQQCGAHELVAAGEALAACLQGPPPAPLLRAYATALHPKLPQLPPSQALAAFSRLVGWGHCMPTAMLQTFLNQARGREGGGARVLCACACVGVCKRGGLDACELACSPGVRSEGPAEAPAVPYHTVQFMALRRMCPGPLGRPAACSAAAPCALPALQTMSPSRPFPSASLPVLLPLPTQRRCPPSTPPLRLPPLPCAASARAPCAPSWS